MIRKFRLEAVNKSAAIFNFNEADARDWTDPKALWMNGEYIKAMDLDELVGMVAGQFQKAGLWRDEYGAEKRDWFATTIDLLRARYRTLVDFTTYGRPYFADEFDYEAAAVKKNLSDERLKDLLPALAERLAALAEFTHESAEAALRSLSDERGVKAGLLINAARTALTGQAVGPGMFDIMLALGREKTVARLQKASQLIK